MLFLRVPCQEHADRSSLLGGCLAAPNRDVPVIFLCRLLDYPEAETSTGVCLRSKEWQKSLINRFRFESLTVVEDRHSHSRPATVPPVAGWRNPQAYLSVFTNCIERVRHQVREYLTNLALACQQLGAVADLRRKPHALVVQSGRV